MSLIGCARIFTAEGAQLDRQPDASHAAGCERVLEDRASNAKADRSGLTACLDHLRKGAVLVVLDLDRLGRRAGELVALIDELAERGTAFKALNSPMDTATPQAERSCRSRPPSATRSATLSANACVGAWLRPETAAATAGDRA